MTTLAVIVPAAACPCAQVSQVAPQLRSRDRIIVVANSLRSDHDCMSYLSRDGRVTLAKSDSALGAAGARNLGAHVAADADVYAFVDADDQVADGWLESIRGPLESRTADVVGGALAIPSAGSVRRVVPGRDFWHHQALFGGNLALSRRAWGLLDGFDETLVCCEDTDLAWRAVDIGLRVEVVGDATVLVSPRRVLDEARQRARWGWWSMRLLRKHNVLDRQHVPTYADIRAHMVTTGWVQRPIAAAASQWAGQSLSRTVLSKTR